MVGVCVDRDYACGGPAGEIAGGEVVVRWRGADRLCWCLEVVVDWRSADGVAGHLEVVVGGRCADRLWSRVEGVVGRVLWIGPGGGDAPREQLDLVVGWWGTGGLVAGVGCQTWIEGNSQGTVECGFPRRDVGDDVGCPGGDEHDDEDQDDGATFDPGVGMPEHDATPSTGTSVRHQRRENPSAITRSIGEQATRLLNIGVSGP